MQTNTINHLYLDNAISSIYKQHIELKCLNIASIRKDKLAIAISLTLAEYPLNTRINTVPASIAFKNKFTKPYVNPI